MITYNPLLCLDFYKTCHAEQYPKGLTKMVSYYTPRMSRLGDTDKVTLFGLQMACFEPWSKTLCVGVTFTFTQSSRT